MPAIGRHAERQRLSRHEMSSSYDSESVTAICYFTDAVITEHHMPIVCFI